MAVIADSATFLANSGSVPPHGVQVESARVARGSHPVRFAYSTVADRVGSYDGAVTPVDGGATVPGA